MYYLQLVVLCLTVASVIGDLPPGTRRNTYLPPDTTKGGGYSYPKPTPTPTFPGTRPPTFPGTRPPTFPGTRPPTFPGTRPTPIPGYPGTGSTGYPSVRPRPTPGYPGTGSTGYPSVRPKPTSPFPEYPGEGTGGRPNVIGPGVHDHHHHEPGMPFDFNYAVKDDAFGNDYSHNAISDGEIVRGEYKIQLPDGRTQLVRYTADWQHGFSAQVTYDGTPRFDGNRGY